MALPKDEPRCKVIYVTNIRRDAGFLYAHPRWHSPPVDLYLFDYLPAIPAALGEAGKDALYVFQDWQGWSGGNLPRPSRVERLTNTIRPIEIYQRIASFGKEQPGSLIELQFFTHGTPEHGFTSGPIGEQSRAEFARTFPKNSEFRAQFVQAFARDALVKLWGCGPQHGAKQRTLSFWATNNLDRRRYVRDRVIERMERMYAYRLSELLGLTVWATPPGWLTAVLPARARYINAWNDKTGPDPKSRWWRVSPQFLKDGGALFYSLVMLANIDPLGYVGFNAVQIEKVHKLPITLIAI